MRVRLYRYSASTKMRIKVVIHTNIKPDMGFCLKHKYGNFFIERKTNKYAIRYNQLS